MSIPQFEITLKIEKLKTYQAMGWITCFAIIILLFALTIYKGSVSYFYFFLALSFIVVYFFFIYRINEDNEQKRTEGLSILLASLSSLLAMEKLYIPFGITLVLAALYSLATKKKIISLSSSGIEYPSFLKKKINWNELNSLVLKDGLLTIDFKNDKLIQQLIEDSEENVNEEKINQYCRQQLKNNP